MSLTGLFSRGSSYYLRVMLLPQRTEAAKSSCRSARAAIAMPLPRAPYFAPKSCAAPTSMPSLGASRSLHQPGGSQPKPSPQFLPCPPLRPVPTSFGTFSITGWKQSLAAQIQSLHAGAHLRCTHRRPVTPTLET
jgi:hypothetical protein